ncbi:putative membrane protein [Streptomyces noursei ATCC 11455]|uniref:FUSC family protein n=1 Tax=Streptomyces noursei TaxID=1971 RepID=UPI00081C6B26|nr:putative membrane protein [Streptomyces noursei ATCC 11455]
MNPACWRGPLGWVLRRPDAAAQLRRALWATLAGLGVFYLLRYGFNEPAMALYALFGAIPITLFSRLPGTARERTAPLLAALPVGLLLVTAGTLLAAHSWSAALGMFVVTFVTSYLGVGGPAAGGLATSFQLYYLLPCFPPYAPESLGQRLGGLAVGMLTAALVDRLLWQGPLPPPYRVLLADAVDATAEYCTALARRIAEPSGDTAAPPHDRVSQTLFATRLTQVALPERPTGASLRHRGLYDVRAVLRHLVNQLDRIALDRHGPAPHAARLLDSTAGSLRRAAGVLRAAAPEDLATDTLAESVRSFGCARQATVGTASPGQLRLAAVVHDTAAAGVLLTEAARIAFDAPPQHLWHRLGTPFRYATVSAPVRYWYRLRLHLTPRSVLFQNALRAALALAGARLLVGSLNLPHGFWVLLATLSLLRTSASDTRGALGPAFLGTGLGAVVAALLVVVAGNTPAVYMVAAPVVVFLGFGVGPLLGPVWVQAALTLTLVTVFAQVEPPSLGIPTWRFLDVLIGGLIGATAALLAWPRGAQNELRRSVVRFMAASAQACQDLTERLCRPPGGQDLAGEDGEVLRDADRTLRLVQAAYTQYRTEGASRKGPELPWELAMAAGYSTVGGGALLLAEHATDTTPLPPAVADQLVDLAARVADDCRRAAELVRRSGHVEPHERGGYLADESGPLIASTAHGAGTGPAAVFLVADLETWLTGIAYDATRVDRVLDDLRAGRTADLGYRH